MSIQIKNPTPPIPEEFLRFLREYQTFYLVTHVEPDGDCIASSLALGSYLERVLGKTVRQFNVGPFERREILRYQNLFTPRISPTHRENDPSPAVIILDCSGPDRIGDLAEDLEDLPVAMIDHHASGKPYGDAAFVDTTALATCHLVQLVLESFDVPISLSEASLLLFGIAADTGYFRHADEQAGTLFAAVSRLLDIGASPKETFRQMMGGHTQSSRELLGRILGRAQYFADGAAVLTYETRADAQAFGKQSRDSDTLYQLLFGVSGVRLVGLLREEGDSFCAGSLRSIDTIDVSRIAADFGGGGHKRAAGFAIDLPLKEVRSRMELEFISAVRADQGR